MEKLFRPELLYTGRVVPDVDVVFVKVLSPRTIASTVLAAAVVNTG